MLIPQFFISFSLLYKKFYSTFYNRLTVYIIQHIPTFFNHFSNQIPIGTASSMSASRLGFVIPINCLRECFQAEIFGYSASHPLNGHKKRALRLGGIGKGAAVRGCSFIVLKCDELEFVNKRFSIINFPLFVQGIINYPYTLYDIIFSIKHHGEHLAMLYEK